MIPDCDDAPALRFDLARHEYLDARTGEVLPNITRMLAATLAPDGKPWVDDRYFTEEGKWRGSEVHRLTLDLDLDAITVDDVTGPHRGWLLAYAHAVAVLRPTWTHLEEPMIHPTLRFGGRPDRCGQVYRLQSVCEIKSGPYHKSHPVQTALQAILYGHECHLPPDTVGRFCIYIRSDGRFKVEQFVDHVDIRRAQKVLRDYGLGV